MMAMRVAMLRMRLRSWVMKKYRIYDSNPNAGLLSILLLKISRDSTTMECTWSLDGYPGKMDPPRDRWYTVYFRETTVG